jgi:hypothetical protein
VREEWTARQLESGFTKQTLPFVEHHLAVPKGVRKREALPSNVLCAILGRTAQAGRGVSAENYRCARVP